MIGGRRGVEEVICGGVGQLNSVPAGVELVGDVWRDERDAPGGGECEREKLDNDWESCERVA